MHIEPRLNPQIDRIYLHTNEGPEGVDSAHSLVAYLQHIDGGYHQVVDAHSIVQAARDDQVVWAEGGDNEHALSICFIGYAAQTPAQWADAYSKGELELAAQQVAKWCREYNVPIVHVHPGAPGQAPTDRGIAEHADDHAPSSAGHTDPGTGFPIDAFLKRVTDINFPYSDLGQLLLWYKEISMEPVHQGESGWKVAALKEMLAHKSPKYDVGNNSTMFGPKLVAVVHQFKVDNHIDPPDGTAFGHIAAKALLGIQ